MGLRYLIQAGPFTVRQDSLSFVLWIRQGDSGCGIHPRQASPDRHIQAMLVHRMVIVDRLKSGNCTISLRALCAELFYIVRGDFGKEADETEQQLLRGVQRAR
jgi:hypothetical protein